uniref:Uridine/cytidine kinase n=1 Tax=Panagrolaimus sp. ES5 TaxID=591445 RepID=A0AC34G675_9BILA
MVQRTAIFRRQAYLIAVAGGTASGKTTVCHNIINHLGDTNKRVVIISQDSFYRNLTAEDLALAKKGDYNFDHPDAFDDALFKQVLCDLKEGLPVKIPCYDFKTHARVVGKEEIIDNADVVLIEGILVFYDPEIRKLFDMRIFVDTDSDIRLARRAIGLLVQRIQEILRSPRSSSTNSLDSEGKQSDEENHIPSICGDYTPH